MKLKFKKNHSPRTIGEVAEFKTKDEIRTANWYLANGIAEICDGVNTGGCADCEEKKAVKAEEIKQSEKVVVVEVTREVDVPLAMPLPSKPNPPKAKATKKKSKKK